MTFTDRMKAELDEVAGAEFERLAESHARERWPIDHRPHKLGEKWRLGFVIGAVWARGMFRRGAEKAERERDAYQHDARAAESALSRVRAALGLPEYATTDDMEEAAESHSLTPDAITDEMVERAKRRFEELDGALVYTRSNWVFRQLLAAALIEPPARPEGAEDIEALIREAVTASGTLDDEALADYLAARLTDPTRKEA